MKRAKVYANPPMDAFAAALAPYVVGAILIWYVTRKAKSELPKKIEEVRIAAGQIKANLPGVIADKLRGVNESTYVSQAQAKINDAAALEAARARKAAGTFSPFVYGF